MGQVNQLSSQGRFMNRHSFAVFSGIVRENHWGSLIRIVPSYSTVSVIHSPSVPSSFCSSRSVIPLVPFVVFVGDSNYSVELDFMEGIGVVEIAISQNGSVIYSSSENILSPLRKYLQLPFGVSGEYCIEIKGDNGAYAYGCFEL